MKSLILLLALCATAHADPGPGFWRALHLVESSGRTTGPILGDYVNGKPQALGPLQIHRGYHKDSRVAGDYSRVSDLNYSVRVATAYLKRYAPEAWAAGDVETLARVHNGGPRGHLKTATKSYGARVKAFSK
jgi:hypothetical protein